MLENQEKVIRLLEKMFNEFILEVGLLSSGSDDESDIDPVVELNKIEDLALRARLLSQTLDGMADILAKLVIQIKRG